MIVEKRINRWIDRYEGNSYLNGSLLIASNGKVLLNKGFGMANQEHQVPNTAKTKFRIGSLTKAFTALCIFQLHEKEQLNINDCIEKYLPGYPKGNQITIYQCLTNTSGIPNFTSFPDFWFQTMRLPSTLSQLIDSFKDRELDFKPGSQYAYSTSGYTLLTAIIEKVSGMTYANYIQQHVCHPLGMYNTGCDDGVKVVPGLASGYSYWEEPIHSAHTDLSFPLGGYGLYSTTGDLLIWDKALRSSQLINKELTEKMFTSNLGSYACGWAVSEVLGRNCEQHFGDISGFSSNFLRFVDENVTIVFLSNINVTPVTHLTNEIAKIIFEENVSLPTPAIPIQFTNINSLLGKYHIKNEPDIALEVTAKDGEVFLTVPKMYGVLYKFKLVPVSHDSLKTTYLTEVLNEQITFHYSPSGEVASVQYKDAIDKDYKAFKDL